MHKIIIIRKVSGLLTLIILSVLYAQAQSLSGNEAVNQLRKTGDYESLKFAFDTARNNFTDGLLIPDAVIQTAVLTSSDGAADDRFGESVSISGNTAVVGDIYHNVGANNDQGAAYVFVRSGTNWTQQAILTAPDGMTTDQFGNSVFIDGDTIAVGSRFDDIGTNPNTNEGSVYVFVRSGTNWIQQTKLVAPGARIGYFGFSVLVSGNTLIVGTASNALSSDGAVFIFARSGATWSFQQKLSPSDFISQYMSGGFGDSVALSGNTLIVSDQYDQQGTNFLRGSVSIYIKNGTVWTPQQKLIAFDTAPGDNYGSSVSISGDTVIVGAYESLNGAGSAYIYNRSGTTWTLQQKLTASGLGGHYRFGNSVMIIGDTVFISTNYYNSSQGESWINKVFIFTRTGSTWTEQERFSQTSPYVFSRFGWSMATDGNNIIVGDIGNPNSNGSRGAAYIFNRNITVNVTVQTSPSGRDFTVDGVAYNSAQTFSWQSGSSHTIGTTTPQTGSNGIQYSWSDWSDGGTISHTVSPTSSATYTANFATQNQTTVQTSPSGRSFIVDGTTFTSAQTFNWATGSTHTIGTTSPQTAGTAGTQYAWANWSDGGTISHTITIPNINSTYTANFNTQYQLTMVANGSGTVSPASGGFYNAGQAVQISATPNSGFALFNWTGTGNGSYDGTNNPASVTMNSPITETANFRSLCSYTLSPSSAFFYRNGGNGNFTVTDSNGCGWGITSNAPWITASITGSTVNYTVDANNAGAPRSGTITVLPGITFTINQSNLTRQPQFDFDGDGKSDVSVFRPSNGAWYLQQSTAGFTGVTFGFGTDKLVPADYDGDGKTDVAVYRNGTWYLMRSSLGFTGVTFGDANDIPVPVDYDGDGKADIAVFRPSNGTWYLQQSTAGFYGVAFGQNGDKPVAADYDGDGKADIAVNRNATWYIQRSTQGFYGITFGDTNDKLVPVDYDGDGKADVAVFRPSNGTWYIQQSTAGFSGIAFGLGTDVPAPADYDGDGKADVGVFRNGTWYLNRSSQGFFGITFGAATDKPLPNVFVR